MIDPRRKLPLTAEYLRDIMSYDPDTGILRWAKKTTKRVVVGEASGHPDKDGYLAVMIYYKVYRSHRLAWLWMTGEWPKHQIDHINGIPADNRWCNLREATEGQNMANKRGYNSLGLKGIWRHRTTGKYWAQVMSKGIKYKRGPFDTPEEAHQAYRELALQHHGEYARFE